jgi:hypothetical protein
MLLNARISVPSTDPFWFQEVLLNDAAMPSGPMNVIGHFPGTYVGAQGVNRVFTAAAHLISTGGHIARLRVTKLGGRPLKMHLLEGLDNAMPYCYTKPESLH